MAPKNMILTNLNRNRFPPSALNLGHSMVMPRKAA